jgi:hypothetical protein
VEGPSHPLSGRGPCEGTTGGHLPGVGHEEKGTTALRSGQWQGHGEDEVRLQVRKTGQGPEGRGPLRRPNGHSGAVRRHAGVDRSHLASEGLPRRGRGRGGKWAGCGVAAVATHRPKPAALPSPSSGTLRVASGCNVRSRGCRARAQPMRPGGAAVSASAGAGAGPADGTKRHRGGARSGRTNCGGAPAPEAVLPMQAPTRPVVRPSAQVSGQQRDGHRAPKPLPGTRSRPRHIKPPLAFYLDVSGIMCLHDYLQTHQMVKY